MQTLTSLAGLAEMHPEREWQEIAAIAITILEDRRLEAPYKIDLRLLDVPGFGSEPLRLLVQRSTFRLPEPECLR